MPKKLILKKKQEWQDENYLRESELKKPKLAKIKVPSMQEDESPKHEASESDSEKMKEYGPKSEGKLIIRKKKGKPSRMDYEKSTENDLSVGIEKLRLKKEQDIYKKFLEGMK